MGSFVRRTVPDMDKTEIFKNLYSRLDRDLPYFLYYHCADHTRSVVDRAVFLSQEENLTKEETYLIKIAALYHDAGFLIGRNDHEIKSCDLATKELPEYGFSKSEIKKICGMILATRIPQQTHNIHEKIVADADLFYLGTNEYNFYSNQLYRELKYMKPDIDEDEWYHIQLDFLKAHTFQTNYGIKILDPVKQLNMRKLIASRKSK